MPLRISSRGRAGAFALGIGAFAFLASNVHNYLLLSWDDFVNSFLTRSVFATGLGFGVAFAFSLQMLKVVHLADDLRHALDYDGTTNARSRGSFFDLMAARKQGGALVICDIDQFKAINDRYGHAVGDQALCHFSRTIMDALDEDMIFARIGGEEFVLFMPDMPINAALARLDFMRDQLNDELLVFEDTDIAVLASFGLTTIGAREDVDLAMVRADNALYTAKRNGRDRVCVANEETNNARFPA